MALEQCIHDQIRAWAAVIYVADDVKAVYGQVLNDVRERDDERIGLPCSTNRLKDFVVIALLGVQRVAQQQLFDDGRNAALARQCFAHAATRVFFAHQTADLDQPPNGNAVPFVVDHALALEQCDLIFRVVDERAECIALVRW